MGLQLKKASSYKLGVLSSLILLAAVLTQPHYNKTALAESASSISPQVFIDSPTEGKVVSYKHDTSVEIRGTINSNLPYSYYYEISGPDEFNYSGTDNRLKSFENELIYNWDLKGLKDGNYSIILKAWTVAGSKDETQSVAKVNVAVDNSAPSINKPIVFIDGPNAENATINGVKTFHITQTEDNPKRMYVELDYKNADGKWQKHFGMEYGAVNVADFTVDSAQYPEDGIYQIKISSDDQFGQHAGYAFGFTIDRTAPSVPEFSAPAGEYGQPQSVALTTNDINGRIYYTTDGTFPTVQSQVYTGPIDVNQDTTIQAVAIDRAGNESAVTQSVYVIKATSGGGVGTPPTSVPGSGSNTGAGASPSGDVIIPLVSGLDVTFDVGSGEGVGSGVSQQAGSFGFFGNASVLGDNNEEDAAVEGLRVSNEREDTIFATTPTAAVVATSNEGWKLFGFAWYWWTLLAGVSVSTWWAMNNLRQRAQSQEM